MASDYVYTRTVEFGDTDMAGIVYFANYLRYMEAAEHAFLSALGFSLHGTIDGVTYGWPRVHVACDFRAPLRFEDEVQIRVCVRQIKSKALDFVFLFEKVVAGHIPVLAAVGEMTTVCVRVQPGQPMRSCAIPQPLMDALTPTPPERYAQYLTQRD